MKWVFFYILLFTTLCCSAPVLETKIEESDSPKAIDYTNALQKLDKYVNSISNPSSYEGLIFKSRVEKDLRFEDFSSFERRMFILFNYENAGRLLALLHVHWSVDTDKDYVAKMMEKLVQLRKVLAVNHEVFAEETFEMFGNELSKAERNNYLSRLRQIHDDQNLVDRKK